MGWGLGLLIWIIVAVPVGIVFGKCIKRMREGKPCVDEDDDKGA